MNHEANANTCRCNPCPGATCQCGCQSAPAVTACGTDCKCGCREGAECRCDG